jgi:hypothetical protein
MGEPESESDDFVGRRMHETPRSAIANLVESLREQGWKMEMMEDESGVISIFREDRDAIEDWPKS